MVSRFDARFPFQRSLPPGATRTPPWQGRKSIARGWRRGALATQCEPRVPSPNHLALKGRNFPPGATMFRPFIPDICLPG